MKIRLHILAQVVLWGLVWLIMGVNQLHFNRFILENISEFIFQIILILLASYYFAPKLLFQKKYLLFIVTSIALIGVSAYLFSTINLHPQRIRPFGPGGPRPPSAFMIHLLLFSVAYIMSIMVETFLFAQKKEEAIAKQKTTLVESELKLLKMQINPHFLFNALNNIYALSVVNSDKTQESISTLSEMLRYVLYDCEQPQVPIQKEIDYINNFINLFKLKSSKPFNINFNFDIENPSTFMEPMLLIPFIENAFKHSGIEKGGDNFVNIFLKSNATEINFQIENSIDKPKVVDDYSGIGLKNVEKRLKLTYPERHTLLIEETTTFKVSLELRTYE